MGFSRQEYWSGVSFPSPGDLPDQASNPGLPHCRQMLYPLSHQESLQHNHSCCYYYSVLQKRHTFILKFLLAPSLTRAPAQQVKAALTHCLAPLMPLPPGSQAPKKPSKFRGIRSCATRITPRPSDRREPERPSPKPSSALWEGSS